MFGKKVVEDLRKKDSSKQEVELFTRICWRKQKVLSLQWLCSFVHMDIFARKFLINFPAVPWRKRIQGRGEDAE